MSQQNDQHALQTALSELGTELAIDLTLDEEGCCYIDYHGTLPLAIITGTSAGLVMTANLGGRDDIPPAVLADMLAEFNWLGRLTRGAALAFNPERARFLLWSAQPAEDADAARIRRQLERLILAALDVGPAIEKRLSRDDLWEEDDAPTPAAGAHDHYHRV